MNRNAPCFCGSGLKYKRCHGAVAATPALHSGTESFVRRSEIARASAYKRLDMEVHDQLLAHVHKRLGRSWITAAISEFSGGAPELVTSADDSLLGPWMLYHRLIAQDTRRPVADVWREEHRLYREPSKDRLVEAQLAAPIGVWEVQKIEPGVGSQVTDLLSGEERFVYDASSTATLQPWLGVLGYVVDCEGISFFGGVHGQPLPPAEVSRVVKSIRRAARVRTRPVAIDVRRDPHLQVDIVRLWREMQYELEHRLDTMTMQNTDGHVIAMQADHFELRADRRLVLRRLAALPGASEPERFADYDEDVIMVTKPKPVSDPTPGSTVVGRVIVTPFRLTIETNSLERADALRAAVEAVTDDALRFQLRVTQDMASLREQAREQRGGRSAQPHQDPRDDAPPEVQEALRQFYMQHTATWADIALPALDGMTPRAAANDRRMRPRLETLLKDIEQKEASSPAGLRMDIPAIRRALGL